MHKISAQHDAVRDATNMIPTRCKPEDRIGHCGDLTCVLTVRWHAHCARDITTDQIPTALVIRRFRSLDMPLEEIHTVLTTADPGARNELLVAHVQRLEMTLART